ncbi:MAG: AraC family transcriptional regulator [Anaerolineales bacterium]|jgi:AraC-like DNA-binding protein|nr:AraC family transcriptional regulator [Anaerolineales bacterium]
MIFQIYQPAFPLGKFIDSFIYFEGFSPAHSLDRFLPDGNTELIIDLAEIPQHIHDNHTLEIIQSCRQAWVSGVRTRPITIPSGKDSRKLVVAFKKGAAHPFYPFPMSELADSVVMADLVFGSSILDLREKLLFAKSTSEMFCLVELFLLGRAGDKLHQTTTTTCIKYAVTNIINQPTLSNFQHLSDQIGYSQKHFIDLFKGQVGLSPKQYLKIMRFQKAIQEIEAGRPIQWSGLAAESGFYDQAHFINNFKNFSGYTPNEYIKRKAGTLNYVPVD